MLAKLFRENRIVWLLLIVTVVVAVSTTMVAARHNISPVVFEQGVCGQTIKASITLTEDIGPCVEDGIIIGANAITLEGNGYKIIGSDNGDGIALKNKKNVTIKRLFIQGFEHGIMIRKGEGHDIDMHRLSDNGTGVFIVSSKGNTVRNSIVADNTVGISISEQSSENRIFHNIIVDNVEQIQDNGMNFWIDPKHHLGNFWGNYWGEDDGSNGRTAGDFVGDTQLPHEGVDPEPLLDPSIPMRFAQNPPGENGDGFLCGDWWGSSLWLVWRGGWSPVDIQVTNPFHQSISHDENEIGPDAFYLEDGEVDPGTKRVQILLLICTLNPFEGAYSFQMTGLEDLSYSMIHFASNENGIVLQHAIQDGVLEKEETESIATWVDEGLGVQLIVPIDIKPGSDPNCINVNAKGIVPVAILTTKTFDATEVVPDSVILDGDSVSFKGKGDEGMAHIEDVDDDSDLDLIMQMEYNATVAGNSTATLRGNTFGGTEIRGSDSICIVP